MGAERGLLDGLSTSSAVAWPSPRLELGDHVGVERHDEGPPAFVCRTERRPASSSTSRQVRDTIFVRSGVTSNQDGDGDIDNVRPSPPGC